MVQRIFVELLLFLTPFMVFLVYRAASRDMLIRDRWPLTTLVLVGTGLAAAALIITPLLEPSESTKCYQAAQYVDGKVIPSKEIPCVEAQPPGALTGPSSSTTEATTSPPPVAPRDKGN
ncbi:MAG TPA: DUF6111 family protein [Hyphomonadaceae bacterium]|nr:DUF6111 family protein [Hyphomonadaceae bacterium]